MSDRVTCLLQVQGRFSPATIEAIVGMCREAGLAYTEQFEDHVAGKDIMVKCPTISFDECKYGGMPDALGAGLEELGISYAWFMGPGLEECAPIVLLWNAENDDRAEFATDTDCQIVLTIAEAEDPDLLAEARMWQDWIDNARVLVGEPELSVETFAGEVAGADIVIFTGAGINLPIDREAFLLRLSETHTGKDESPYELVECIEDQHGKYTQIIALRTPI